MAILWDMWLQGRTGRAATKWLLGFSHKSLVISRSRQWCLVPKPLQFPEISVTLPVSVISRVCATDEAKTRVQRCALHMRWGPTTHLLPLQVVKGDGGDADCKSTLSFPQEREHCLLCGGWDCLMQKEWSSLIKAAQLLTSSKLRWPSLCLREGNGKLSS